LQRPDELDLRALVDTLAAEADGPGWQEPVERLRDELTELRGAVEVFGRDAPDTPLALEVAPWLKKARLEADAGLSALRLLQQVRPVASRGPDGNTRAAAPDSELALVHVFALLFAWTTVRDAGPEVVLGPRFSFHPAVVQLEDGRAAVDVALAVQEGASVIDDLCRLALEHYSLWTALPAEPVRVMTATRELEVDDRGSCRAESGEMVLVRSGPLATRIGEGGATPFLDARLL
jgi:hypothetical protein